MAKIKANPNNCRVDAVIRFCPIDEKHVTDVSVSGVIIKTVDTPKSQIRNPDRVSLLWNLEEHQTEVHEANKNKNLYSNQIHGFG